MVGQFPAKLAEVGDARWRELLEAHHALIRRQLVRYSGREINTAGDGFFASFDGPARAIRCAQAISDGVRVLGLHVRAGLLTGQCEVVAGEMGGIAVHIGARVAMEAQADEVVVSSTVKDLVAGSGLAFADRGYARLKGVRENGGSASSIQRRAEVTPAGVGEPAGLPGAVAGACLPRYSRRAAGPGGGWLIRGSG